MSLKHNWQNLAIHTFAPQMKMQEEFAATRSRAVEDNSHKRLVNYLPENFVLENQLVLSLVLREERGIAFSSIFQADSFPEASARILNRYFIHSSERAYSAASDINSIGLHMATQQIEYLKFHHPEVDYVFISMEAPKAGLVGRWVKEMKRFSNISFTFDSGKLFLVQPYAHVPSCWQHVAYAQIQEKAKGKFILPNRDLAEWKEMRSA